MITATQMYEEESEGQIAAKLLRLSFSSNPVFQWKFTQEGLLDFKFGTRTGPTNTTGAVIHDIAHVIELGSEHFEERFALGGILFQLPERFFIDRFVCEPTTAAMTEREARTHGIELRLWEMMGFEVERQGFFDNCFSLAQYLPDSYFYYYKKRRDEHKNLILDSYNKHSPEKVNKEMNTWLYCVQNKLDREQDPQMEAADVE